MMMWSRKNRNFDNKNTLKGKVLDIIDDSPYVLKNFLIDNQHFGNIIITLRRNELMLRFIQDRDFSWSELGFVDFPNDWLDFTTTLKVLGISSEDLPHELIKLLRLTIVIEEKYHNKLSALNNKEDFDKLKKEVFLAQKHNSPFWKGVE